MALDRHEQLVLRGRQSGRGRMVRG